MKNNNSLSGETMKLKSLVLAAMLAVSSGAVLAEDLNQNVSMATSGLGSYTAHFGADHNFAGAFTDIFVFNPAVGASFANAVIQSVSLFGSADLNLTSVSLNGNPLSLIPSGGYEFGLLTPVPVSGVLTMTVIGTTLTPSASYSGDINVIAVPEPETYGMLLAGLGILGLLARRQKGRS